MPQDEKSFQLAIVAHEHRDVWPVRPPIAQICPRADHHSLAAKSASRLDCATAVDDRCRSGPEAGWRMPAYGKNAPLQREPWFSVRSTPPDQREKCCAGKRWVCLRGRRTRGRARTAGSDRIVHRLIPVGKAQSKSFVNVSSMLSTGRHCYGSLTTRHKLA